SLTNMAAPFDGWKLARRAALLILFVAVPAAFDPHTFDVFNLTKYTVVMTGAIAIAVLWAVEWVRRGKPPLWRNGLHWPVLTLLGWTVIGTLLSSDVRISL